MIVMKACHTSLAVTVGLVLLISSLVDDVDCGSFLSSSSDSRKSGKLKRPLSWHNDLVDSLMLNYSKHVTPNDNGITAVAVGIYVDSLSSIREQEMDYSISFHLRLSWRDPRLQFDPKDVYNTNVILLHDDMWQRLWIPDIAFRNEKSSRFHNIMFPNRVFHLRSDGEIYLSVKITATLSCAMDLHKYPFDSQKCPLTIESITHPKELLVFKWMNDTVMLNMFMTLPQFRLTGTSLSACEISYFSGTYPCAQIDFSLERDKRYYLLQIYVPSFLVVVLSWVSFWISMEAVPARVSIGLVTVLTMATQSNSVNKALPRVSYLKAIDVWMVMCLFFVFASLLEYCLVNVFSRRDLSRKVKRHIERHHTLTESDKRSPEPMLMEEGHHCQHKKNVLLSRKIDKISRVLFPVNFCIFNIVYWAYYAS